MRPSEQHDVAVAIRNTQDQHFALDAAMLAAPTPDTLSAGPGGLRQGVGWAHSGEGQRATIY